MAVWIILPFANMLTWAAERQKEYYQHKHLNSKFKQKITLIWVCTSFALIKLQYGSQHKNGSNFTASEQLQWNNQNYGLDDLRYRAQ